MRRWLRRQWAGFRGGFGAGFQLGYQAARAGKPFSQTMRDAIRLRQTPGDGK